MDKLLNDFKMALLREATDGDIQSDNDIDRYVDGFIKGLELTTGIDQLKKLAIYDIASEIKEYCNLPYYTTDDSDEQ